MSPLDGQYRNLFIENTKYIGDKECLNTKATRIERVTHFVGEFIEIAMT